MYVYICIYIHVCMLRVPELSTLCQRTSEAYIHTHTHRPTHVYTHIHMYVCVCICIHTHTHAYRHKHIYEEYSNSAELASASAHMHELHTYIHAQVSSDPISAYVNMYVCVQIHTYQSTHIQINMHID